MSRRIRWWEYWNGRWRLHYNCCPRCNSSPPTEACEICRGDRNYGPKLTHKTKVLWRYRWDVEAGRGIPLPSSLLNGGLYMLTSEVGRPSKRSWLERVSHDCEGSTWQLRLEDCGCLVRCCLVCNRLNESLACSQHGTFHHLRTR